MLKIALTIRKKEDQTIFFMNNTYYQFLSPFFDIELVVPRLHHDYHDVAKRNDALLICGGDDLDPTLYHEEPHIKTHNEDKSIETMDIAIFQQFHQLEKPIIGICRGIQVVNVLLGGTLYQDIDTLYTTPLHHNKDSHIIYPVQDTFFSQYIKDPLHVNSFHHQNIKELSPLLKANAISSDGLIEGVENDFILAVQWHPERMNQESQNLFIRMILDFINS